MRIFPVHRDNASFASGERPLLREESPRNFKRACIRPRMRTCTYARLRARARARHVESASTCCARSSLTLIAGAMPTDSRRIGRFDDRDSRSISIWVRPRQRRLGCIDRRSDKGRSRDDDVAAAAAAAAPVAITSDGSRTGVVLGSVSAPLTVKSRDALAGPGGTR